MNQSLILTLIGILTFILTANAGYDAWKRRTSARSTDVVSAATQLLGPYKEEVTQLRKDLAEANTELKSTRQQVRRLSADLSEAQAELNLLRIQIRNAPNKEKGLP